MKRSTTLRAFLLSCVSVFLCVAMLMGSTFAWFTDSVESAKNVIAAGNLDIELYHADKGTNGANVEVKNDTVLFDDVDSTKWEPGAMAYEVFTVENKGSLALKYQFSLEALNATVVGGHSFAEMLQVAVISEEDIANGFSYSRDKITALPADRWSSLATFSYTGNLVSEEEATKTGATLSNTAYYGIVIWWQPTADDNIFNMRNENNGKEISVEVGVKLVATQYTFENDSFDSSYDKDANQIYTSTAVKLPTAGNATVNDTVLTTVDDVDMEVTLSADFLTALAQNNDAPTSVALSHAEPKFDTVNKTIKFDHIEIVDENGDIIDLEAIGNDKPVTVKFNVGDAFNVGDTVIVYHDGELFATPVVDADKNITYTATHFCEVVVGYNDGKIDTAKEFLATVNGAEDGDVITLAGDISNEDGILITDKNLTIDLNGKTFTVSEGASTNNRNFKINGTSVVTIKNGTMIAAGELTSGAYGTIRTEGTAKVTLEGLKLYNYRGNGLNIKACSGTTVIINDTEIYSQYGGGVEAAGGTVELTNVTIDQKGMWTSPYNSMAISVNGGGKAIVNNGTYTTACLTAEEANNQGSSHGPWTIGVLNSGGTLIVNGGTFSNDNFGDNALATSARGLILADTAANIQINGGTFNAVKAIIDMTNNLGDASRNPSATLAGGTFSADPTVSGLYASHLITIAKGYEAYEENGVWTIAMGDLHVTDAADLEYARPGHTIYIDSDITLTEEFTIPANVTLVGSGKQINGTIYAGGNLTIEGHIKVTAFSASYYNRVITIGPDACFEVTGTGRVSLAYGNVFNITGTVKDAKTADKSTIQPSLIIPGGISITGGSDATMNITNAYVVIGGTSSKNNAAGGTFTFNFKNSVVEFTDYFTLAEPTSGKTPTFVMNVKDSVVTAATKFIIAAPNSTVVLDNSTLTTATYFRNSGELTLKNGSELTASTIQFGENGGNNGTTIVDNSTFTITATSTGYALDGKGTGKIIAKNGATVSVDYYKGITVECDETSTFEGTEVK